MSWTQISHDGFARQSLMRRVKRHQDKTLREKCDGCDWCGSHGTNSRLFEYGTERDDRGGVNPHKGQFCSKSCHDAYHS